MEYYRHADWLGSARLTSTSNRTVSGDVAYAPFGETYAESGSPELSFTGQNPDTNANLYDFMYREYGIQGRWPSPDPLGPGAFNLSDPQSLDRYAYVRNNPTGLVDPLGLVNIPGYRSLVDAYAALGGGGFGMSCTADGIYAPCSMVGDLANSGGAGICPDDSCAGITAYDPSKGFYGFNYARSITFLCDGPNLAEPGCSPVHDWLAWSGLGENFISPLDLSGDIFVGTPEDQQIHSLANAVVAKAGYLTDWQFWAEAGATSALGAVTAGAEDAALTFDAGPFPSLAEGEQLGVIVFGNYFPGGVPSLMEFISGASSPGMPAGAGSVAEWLGSLLSNIW